MRKGQYTDAGINRRNQMLKYIRKFHQEHGYPPTIRDIVKGTDITTTSIVKYHLKVLVDTGKVLQDPNTARSIRVVDA